jgi:phosphohistidine phosphatase SixA
METPPESLAECKRRQTRSGAADGLPLTVLCAYSLPALEEGNSLPVKVKINKGDPFWMKSSNSFRRMPSRGFAITLAIGFAILLAQDTLPKAALKSPLPEEEFKVTTVFLIRHAEKADAPKEDPPLDEKGKLRSQELARMLAGAGVKAIYTSQYLRTKQTGEALAKQLGLTITPIPLQMSQANPREVSEQAIAEITGKIYEHAGDAALVIGHSNTIPAVIKKLGGDVVPQIDEKKFDDLFVVIVYGKGKAKVVQMKYGSST